jgi:hypothetical protein
MQMKIEIYPKIIITMMNDCLIKLKQISFLFQIFVNYFNILFSQDNNLFK